ELFLNGLAQPYRDEARSLIRGQIKEGDRFIAVSGYCGRFMSTFLEIPSDRMSIVPLGIQTAGCEPLADREQPFTIGYFARVAPEKGLQVLAEAFIKFSRRIGSAP